GGVSAGGPGRRTGGARDRRPGAAFAAAGSLHRRRVRDHGGAVMSVPEATGSSVDQSASITDRWAAALMPTYPTPSLALVRGDGAVVIDDAGRRYLDLFGGIAVNALGHAHPAVVRAVSD